MEIQQSHLSSTKTVVFKSANLLVVLQDYPSDHVFVTFNEMTMVVDELKFWGDSFFAGLKSACVGVVTTEPNWYPRAQMELAIVEIRRVVLGRRLITYGHSQGGYGALKFSKSLGAAAAISFCPQYSISPEVVGDFDRRFVKYYLPALENGLAVEALDLCEKSYVFFDPHEPTDAINADRLKSISGSESKGINIIPVPFSGHGTVRLLTESKSATLFIKQFLEPQKLPSTSDLRKIFRSARKASRTYMFGRLQYLTKVCKKHPIFFERSLDAISDDKSPVIDVIRCVARNQIAEANKSLEQIVDYEFSKLEFYFLWNVFRRLSYPPGERRLAEATPGIYKNDPFIRLHAVNSFIALNEPEAARRELNRICLLPTANQHTDLIIGYANRLAIGSARLGNG